MRTVVSSSVGLAAPSSSHDKGYILVVDDDVEINLLLTTILRQQGLRVATALTAQDAKKLVRQRMPMAITLDLNLPDEDGESFALWLRQHGGTDVPIVVVSASVNIYQVARRITAAAAVAKPFDVDELIWALTVALAPVRR